MQQRTRRGSNTIKLLKLFHYLMQSVKSRDKLKPVLLQAELQHQETQFQFHP